MNNLLTIMLYKIVCMIASAYVAESLLCASLVCLMLTAFYTCLRCAMSLKVSFFTNPAVNAIIEGGSIY